MRELFEAGGFISAVLGVLILVMALFLLPIIYSSEVGNIQGFKSVKATVENARANGNISAIELAALQHKIVESNSWLAKAQYWNNFPIISLYIPEKVMELEPIK